MITSLLAATTTVDPDSTSSDEGGVWILIILLGLFGLITFVMFIAAVISIASNQYISGNSKAVWIIMCFFFPLIVSIVWFIVGNDGGAPSRGYDRRPYDRYDRGGYGDPRGNRYGR